MRILTPWWIKFSPTPIILMISYAVLAGCTHQSAHSLKIDEHDCVSSPHLASGEHYIIITNNSSHALEFSLTSSTQATTIADEKVFADIEQFAPHTSRILEYTINPGTYRFRCFFDEHAPVNSSLFMVRGVSILPPYSAIVPVSLIDVTPAAQHYESWINQQLPLFTSLTHRLYAAIQHKNLAATWHYWEKTHSLFETLGAAYDAFGDYGKAINTSSAGLTYGVHDQNFIGIHAIEHLLYTLPPQASQTSIPSWKTLTFLGNRLMHDAAKLQQAFKGLRIDPITLGLRAHEIIENTIQFTLSGRDDYGSHTSVDTIWANLQGTRQVLHFVHPLLTSRFGQLTTLHHQLHDSIAWIDSHRASLHAHAITTWPHKDRNQITTMLNALVAQLAKVAVILDIRRR